MIVTPDSTQELCFQLQWKYYTQCTDYNQQSQVLHQQSLRVTNSSTDSWVTDSETNWTPWTESWSDWDTVLVLSAGIKAYSVEMEGVCEPNLCSGVLIKQEQGSCKYCDKENLIAN